VAQSRGETAQNTGALRDDANLRIEPGRSTAVIRRLSEGTKVEIINRQTLPRPNTETAKDVWLKVRPSPTEIGWVLGTLVEFDVPVNVSQYTEGLVYAAVKPLNQVQDSLAGPIYWYVIGERRPGLSSDLDFDGVRVFTWNLRRHRYETAFRIRGVRGVYPLEVGQDGNNPTFRIHELSEDGTETRARNFVMNGVIVREVERNET